ncbi:iron complex transport system ATP-binding protein [Desulfovibrio desulfuricans]|uniref:Iron complex transport system ATP-binding protein n=1 Tax=Desulfovibrio desulfuricans TaxID=876 RepID=A0AA94HQB9_DESDE|nr:MULTISPECIES: ABC transporter ATP-binding protein [Desulfovibrio]ATD81716.1 iron ABC transporter ATP-binding protein [Desulfovibrio sp. G11]SFW17095.1 iron complex transport system ATP-binding protein [Desulfovibrio desulfuricans]SPD34442.1 ABC transporter [Desulfovibrio sp. G11]
MTRPLPVQPDPPHAPGREASPAAHAGGPPILEARALCAGYRERPVLQDICFTARRGECVALLGPNGSGKTTLLRCLSGVLPAGAGSVFLQGRPLAGLKPRQRARLAAVVPQGGRFPQELTARQMVLLGRYPHLSWLGSYGRRDHEAVDAALAACEAELLAPRRLAELSGGELQRVLLARALAQESPLLLLDELAAGLDMARMVGLFDLLERRRAAGACVLMAVHDCNLAAVYATRLLGLKAGRLFFDGPVDAVFTEEKLSALYDIPIDVLPHPRWGLPQALLARARGPRSSLADSCNGAASFAADPDGASAPGSGFCR